MVQPSVTHSTPNTVRSSPQSFHQPAAPFSSTTQFSNRVPSTFNAPTFSGYRPTNSYGSFGSGSFGSGYSHSFGSPISPIRSYGYGNYYRSPGLYIGGFYGNAYNPYYRSGYSFGALSFGGYPGSYGIGLSFGLPFGLGLGLGWNTGYGYGGYGSYGYGGYGSYGYNRIYQPYGTTYSTVLSPTVQVSPLVGTATPVQQMPPPEPSVSVASYASQADSYFRNGDYDAALKAYQHAVVDAPNDGAVLLKAAQALSASGKFAEAAGAAQQGLSLLPPEQWLASSKEAASLYDTSTAADTSWTSLKKAADAPKADAGIRFMAGVAAAGRGDYDRAIADLKAVRVAVPQDPVAKQLLTLVEAKASGK
jgi:hypothetical protein